jgi:hypothetical protein
MAEPDPTKPRVVKGDQKFDLTPETFRERFLARFYDPAFEKEVPEDLERVLRVAWEAYHEYRKGPRTTTAGPEFAHPEAKLPIEWLETRRRILEAKRRQEDPATPSRVLVINGSARTDQSCPGEISKTYRLAKIAQGMGVWAEGPITDPAKLGPALQRAVAIVRKGGPALVDVVCQGR